MNTERTSTKRKHNKYQTEVTELKQTEVTELKNTITERKTTLEGFNSRRDEERISDLEDRAVEQTQIAQKKKKNYFLSEDSLRDLWDNI